MQVPVSYYVDSLSDFTKHLLKIHFPVGDKHLVKTYYGIDTKGNFEVNEEGKVVLYFKTVNNTTFPNYQFGVTFVLILNGEYSLTDGTKFDTMGNTENVSVPLETAHHLVKHSPSFKVSILPTWKGNTFGISEYTSVYLTLLIQKEFPDYEFAISTKEVCDLVRVGKLGKNAIDNEVIVRIKEMLESINQPINKGERYGLSAVNYTEELDLGKYKPYDSLEDLIEATLSLPYHERLYLFGLVSDYKIKRIHNESLGMRESDLHSAYSKIVSMNAKGMDLTGPGLSMPAGWFLNASLGTWRGSINDNPLFPIDLPKD